MDNKIVERVARESYAAWREHYGHTAPWGELRRIDQLVWMNVAHEAIAETRRHTTKGHQNAEEPANPE